MKDFLGKLMKIEFVKFCITGGLGLITDVAVFHIMKKVLHAEESKIILFIIPVFGYTAAVAQNYVINHMWTFKKETDTKKISTDLFLKFFLVSLFALAPRYLVYKEVLEYFGSTKWLFPDIANFCGIIAGTIVNFFGSKFLVFRFKKDEVR
ncbi:MAG TPA: GtrA family protein [bacterium]|nr:GtrA family protein [bacterium]HPS29103.1 GtrA family protein [bacterium]